MTTPLTMLFRNLVVVTILLLVFTNITTGQQDCSSSDTYYTPAQDQYIFSYFNISAVNAFDGPTSVTGAYSPTATTSMTKEELNYYMYFAGSVYCPYTVRDLTCCYCGQFNETVSNYTFINNTVYNALAMITVHPNKSEVVVTFRGTVSIMNVIADLYFVPVTYSPGIQLHRGFYLSLMSIYNELLTELQPILKANPSYRVVSTGHSLGGAMASLFVFFMKSLNQFPGTNYVLATYGQPRTGNKGYANYMNALTIPMGRVVSRGDIVAHVNPVSAFGTFGLLLGVNYVHHTQEVWINGNNTRFCSKTVYEDASCSNSMGPTYTLLDHGQYFNVNLFSCFLVEGWGEIDVISLPIGFTPTDYVPPMPSKIYNFLNPIVEGGYEGVLPLL